MRLTVRPGADPIARSDPTILAAMGLPGGGVLRIGRSHVLVRSGEVPGPATISLGPRAMRNTGAAEGRSVEVRRASLPQASRVVFEVEELPMEGRQLARALHGLAITAGDVVAVDSSYGDAVEEVPELLVADVQPGGAGIVGTSTVVASRSGAGGRIAGFSTATVPGEPPTTSDALLAGLDAELDVLTGWLSLLTSADDLPAAWGLPAVAGVLLEGPAGCGKSELVAAAAQRAGAAVREVSLELVFKPERLLDVLEKVVRDALPPSVVFVDRLDAVAGDEGLFRTQVGAILRWFLDAVAERSRVACVLGISAVARLGEGLASSPLLPRTLSIPPPDLTRRRMLFEAALARVPSGELDFETLAARSAGFSGADIVASVVHASAMVAGSGGSVDNELVLESMAGIKPSLGAISTGELPSYGFERVANLTEVKQRLTEAVVWPMTDPERFRRLGITPPRGILLWGPPGTGKTFVVRALAHESGAAFFAVKGAELLDKYVGESERGVREVFARARAAAPAIVFFDEIDALAPIRGRSTTSVTDSVVAALLTEIDGVAARGDVVVIGATNRKDLIDPALLRSGRFETHVELGLPDRAARRAMLDIVDVPFAHDIDLDAVTARTEGLSFADLDGLVREAALEALRADPKAITVGNGEIDRALRRFRRQSAQRAASSASASVNRSS